MPFLDVLAHEALLEEPADLARRLTEALTSAWGIPEDIVTVFLTPVRPGHYAHAGSAAPEPARRRVFVKLHGFPRGGDEKRAAARALTAVFVDRAVPPDNVITYFLDRPPEEVAHGSALASDAPAL